MVIRVPYAGGIGGVEHHCDSSEAYYAHTPGLKVVTPGHRRGRVLAAAGGDRRPGPGGLPGAEEAATGRKAEVELPRPDRAVRPRRRPPARSRRDPDRLRPDGAGRAGGRRGRRGGGLGPRGRRPAHASSPFDDETVAASVRRTGRCVVVHEAQGFAGVGAEIAARVQERCFHPLHAPVLRVSGLRHPLPAAEARARTTCPGVDRVLDAVARLQWDDRPIRAELARVASAA